MLILLEFCVFNPGIKTVRLQHPYEWTDHSDKDGTSRDGGATAARRRRRLHGQHVHNRILPPYSLDPV